MGGKPSHGLLRVAFMTMFAAASVACSPPPGEDALRQQVVALEAAVEAGEGQAVLGLVTDDFAGPGGMDREGLRRYMAALRLGQRKVEAVVGPQEVELHGVRAAVRADVAVAGLDRFSPDNTSVRRLDSTWRLVDGEWRLAAADWQQPTVP